MMGRAVRPPRERVPWELPAPRDVPRGLRNRRIVVGGLVRRCYLLRAPDEQGNPRQAYMRLNRNLPAVGDPAQRSISLCVVLPRDDADVQEVTFRAPPENDFQRVLVKRIRRVNQAALVGTGADPLVEATVMNLLNDEQNMLHTIPILDLLQDDVYVYIVMPFAAGGDLFDFITRLQPPTRQEIQTMFAHIVANMAHLQQQPHRMCHRDLKGENIVINDNGTSTLIDLATCLRVPVAENGQDYHLLLQTERAGTQAYMAPEVFENLPVFDGFKSDVWSLGVLLFVMLERRPLYNIPSAEDNEYRRWIINNGFQDFPPVVRDLLTGMLNPNFHERFNLDEVQQHVAIPWY